MSRTRFGEITLKTPVISQKRVCDFQFNSDQKRTRNIYANPYLNTIVAKPSVRYEHVRGVVGLKGRDV